MNIIWNKMNELAELIWLNSFTGKFKVFLKEIWWNHNIN